MLLVFAKNVLDNRKNITGESNRIGGAWYSPAGSTTNIRLGNLAVGNNFMRRLFYNRRSEAAPFSPCSVPCDVLDRQGCAQESPALIVQVRERRTDAASMRSVTRFNGSNTRSRHPKQFFQIAE
jgi:hypothetical protein